MSQYIICPDAFVHFSKDRPVFSNPRARTHIALSYEFLSFLSKIKGSFSSQFCLEQLERIYAQDSTHDNYGEYGLHGDHTGLLRGEVVENKVSGTELFDVLCKRWIIVKEDMQDYKNFLQPLTSVIDRSRLGDFHQRVGQYLFFAHRKNDKRWSWWHDQKFASDGKSVKEGIYKNVQEQYINDYFSKNDINNLKILDFGCGNGFYSAKLADFGADIVGIDTSLDLINLAKKNFSKKADFINSQSSQDTISFLQKNKGQFDIVFMQDILLLLLRPEKDQVKDVNIILKSLSEVLKPSGRLIAMEPNATFFLAGRYGDPDCQYSIVTEYRNSQFNIVPTLPEVISKMGEAGFLMSEYVHPLSKDGAELFNDNFCIWDFMSFVVKRSYSEN